jgi:hypothetical protein
MNSVKNRNGKAKKIEVVSGVGKYGKELCDLDIFFGALEEVLFKL